MQNAEKDKLVAHLRDGEIVKGYSRDFGPGCEAFHLTIPGERVTSSRRIDVEHLKALFFVRSWGRPSKVIRRNYQFGVGGLRCEPGPRVLVRFRDGERIWGYVLPDAGPGSGFYLTPADPDDNNTKIWVVRESVDDLRYVDQVDAAGGH